MIKTITLLVSIIVIQCSFVRAQPTVKIKNDVLSVEVSTLGAELQSIKKISTKTEYLWQGDEEHWVGKAPVMFPVCVKFKDQQFSYQEKEYEMPDMGLAKIADFRVLETSREKVTMVYTSDKSSLEKYPFRFQLKIIYELVDNKVINRFELKNMSNRPMYFALGGHPGFRFPVEEKGERKNNAYTFSKKFNLARTEIAGGLVQDNQIAWLKNEDTLPLSDERIPNAGMFVKDMPSRIIGVGVLGEPAFIEVDLGDFPNVNLWSPPGMPFACIEPMLGHHDLQNSPLAIEEKPYLIELPGGEERSYEFSIIVK